MFQVRFHGRGGQGVVTAAELLSIAAFTDGHFAQAFPSFGSERAGAPVTAFCRIAERAIRTRAPVVAPDALVVQDATLLHQVDLFNGLDTDGYLLVNTARDFDALGLSEFVSDFRPQRLATVSATDLARTHLGRPIPNAVLLGGLAALCGIVSLESVSTAIRGRFAGAVAEGNVAAAEAAHHLVAEQVAQRTEQAGEAGAAHGASGTERARKGMPSRAAPG